MNAPEPSLAERVTRLEIQVASMHAELKGLIETSVAELKGMIAALAARIDAQNIRLDAMNQRLDDQAGRLGEHSRRMDSLEAYMRKMNATIIITGISVAVSVIFGVGAINSSLISGMTTAFQAGDGSARWRANVERDIGELKTQFAEMDARQRRDSAELRKESAEMRKESAEMREEMRAIRKLLERRAAAPAPEPSKR
jgi:uncharacterized coiled-coil protein SlyX